jgi:hypothetical protein
MKKALRILFYLSILLATAALYAVTYFNRGLAPIFFSKAGYYIIFLLVLFWGVTLAQCAARSKTGLKALLRTYGPGIMACLILVSFIFISVEPYLRALPDETNLMNVSRSMTYEKRTDNVVMGLWYYDMFFPTVRMLEKRPLVFPFFTHIFHTILGYRVENVFVLNFFVLFFLLFLIYTMIRRRAGDIWAVSAVLLVASQPIVTQCATSGGFDLLAALFAVISFMSLRSFIADRSSLSFRLLWLNLLILANIRYEGVIPFALVIAALACFGYIRKGLFTSGMNVVYFLTPLIFIPTFWQKILITVPYRVGPPGVAAFSMTDLVKHNLDFLNVLRDFRFDLPYNVPVSLIGFIGILYFGFRFAANRAEAFKGQRHIAYISTACVAAYWVLVTSYHVGVISHPAVSRYFILFFILLSVSAVMFLSHNKILRRAPGYMLAFSIVMFTLYHPLSVNDAFSKHQWLSREHRFVTGFLKNEASKDRGFLVVYGGPMQLTAYNYGAVTFDYINREKLIDLYYNRHLFDKIFVVQSILYETMQPPEELKLDERFAIETLAERQINENYFVRISKVTAITPEQRRDELNDRKSKSLPDQQRLFKEGY